MKFKSTKVFDCVSTAHRNWRAASNPNRDSRKCAYIHGYTKSFTFVFGCSALDEHGWVYDYSTSSSSSNIRTMTAIKEFINDQLDHGVTTDDQDPMLDYLKNMHDLELIKLVVVPTTGHLGEGVHVGSVEGLCRYMHNMFNPMIKSETNGRVFIESVTIHEHRKNSSTYSIGE